MLIKIAVIVIVACTTLRLSTAQEKRGPDPTARDLDQWSDADIATWMRSRLDHGSIIRDDISVAEKYRSAIVVPLTEKKIEEVLKSASPATCFSDPTVDPEEFVREAAGLTPGAGDENALKAASQLMKIDEARFGWTVGIILFSGMGYRNPFMVAYGGLAIGEPAVDSRVGGWTG